MGECKCKSLLKSKAYGTRCSQAVPHPSTILARRCLTSVIGRERVCSSWYGRRRRSSFDFASHGEALGPMHAHFRACTLACTPITPITPLSYALPHALPYALCFVHSFAFRRRRTHAACIQASRACVCTLPWAFACRHACTLGQECEKFGTLHEFACHPCAGAMLIFSVSFQF